MWVGEVPFELKILSLPEVILVSRYLAAAYVVKLYPKKRSAKWMSGDQLTSALRGNVASYYLKTEDVASMVDEGYLPPRSTVLAATIAVTFIGQNNISLRALKTMFTVERLKVANALRWLIANNKFYAHIKISEANLQSLPMNGVPVEILSTTKWASDADVGAGEYKGYVPHNDDVSSDDGLDDVEGQMMDPGTT
ncbi:ATP-dependent DNA helicase PIF1 [Lentinula edodes]|uniref:ATP-dependent DNA helicase PIF1 n=1 Tax=Lentinula edodes TaxID=5353 RepID=A0A1Q3ELQ1_LENED|nr:ATP-dependent DNA helicase PIF1 [Lentinula edodes]